MSIRSIVVALRCVTVAAILLLACDAGRSYAQNRAQTIPLDKPAAQKARNVRAESATFKGRPALRVTDAAPSNAGDGDRLLLLTATEFQDGVIEVKIAGDLAPNAAEGARGFVGVAFRVAPDVSRFECFYLRPTNGRADDQVRRNHSTQYISYPDFPWPRLRKEFPEKYESYVDLTPGEWTQVRIEVRGAKAKLYVHGATQPALLVNDLKLGEAKGAIGLWVGPGTVAHFADLRVSP